LEMAAKGLDKNMEGMDVTGARMDNLRRNESVGWYRTIINTAIVIVLVSAFRFFDKRDLELTGASGHFDYDCTFFAETSKIEASTGYYRGYLFHFFVLD